MLYNPIFVTFLSLAIKNILTNGKKNINLCFFNGKHALKEIYESGVHKTEGVISSKTIRWTTLRKGI